MLALAFQVLRHQADVGVCPLQQATVLSFNEFFNTSDITVMNQN
jgi:hypothetical protein